MKRLAVGQGLLAQVAGVVVSVGSGEVVAVELAGVCDQLAGVVVAKGLAAEVVLEAGQAAGFGIVVEPGSGVGGTLFDEPVGGVVAVVGAASVRIDLGDEVAGVVVAVLKKLYLNQTCAVHSWKIDLFLRFLSIHN